MTFKSVGNRIAGCLWNESGTRGLIVFAHGPIDEQGSNGYMTIVRKKGSKTVNEDTICQVVIDLQNDITKNYREIIEIVNATIDWAVQKGLYIVYIQHNNLSDGTRTFKPGTHGAELDTFAFREKEFLSKHKVFEVDHPLTQSDKLERIARAGWTIPDNLTFVPVDFTKDSLTERLIAAGFDTKAKSFFSWLGVTYYLSAEAIGKTLTELSSLCADGSTLVFDYSDENFFEAPEKRVQNTIMMAKAGGEPMQSAFSYSELEKLLEKHGFLIYELLTPDDIQRDIIDKVGAEMKAFEHVNYCLAVREY